MPSGDENHQYLNRHHQKSINALVAIGMTGRFYLCNVLNAGSIHDGYSFDNSELKNYIPRIRNGVMIADTAFKSHLPNLATRFSNADAFGDQRKTAYNEIFTRKRNCVERGIGQWKSRCHALLEKMRFHDVRDSAKMIKVGAAIHNWMIQQNKDENDYSSESENNSDNESIQSASTELGHAIPLVPQRRNNRIITTSEQVLNNPAYRRYFP